MIGLIILLKGIFGLLIVFQFKHLIADYYLQFPYMYENKGKPGITNWVRPLFDHAMVHTTFTFVIIFGFLVGYLELAYDQSLVIAGAAGLFDFVTHFVTDRWKATRKGGPDTAEFWQHLGIDQMVHHIVGIIITFGTIGWAVSVSL